jgi:NAD-dependent deacetylase
VIVKNIFESISGRTIMEAEARVILDQLVPILQQAQHVVVLTGAGISAESGLPTFRDPMTGLWAQYRPEELGTPQAFRQNPRLVWEWFAWRRELVQAVAPNPAHQTLAVLEYYVPKLTIITQNVDGLHQQAGSKQVIELHGNLAHFKCFEENEPITEWPTTEEIPPRCPRCGGFVRPDVVWFGERLPEQALSDALAAAKHCDLFFSIGTSGTVEPAASLPYRALDGGAAVVISNLEVPNRATPPLYYLNGKAGILLPQLLQGTWPESLGHQTIADQDA